MGFMLFGLYATIEWHRLRNQPELYSMHSWLGVRNCLLLSRLATSFRALCQPVEQSHELFISSSMRVDCDGDIVLVSILSGFLALFLSRVEDRDAPLVLSDACHGWDLHLLYGQLHHRDGDCREKLHEQMLVHYELVHKRL